MCDVAVPHILWLLANPPWLISSRISKFDETHDIVSIVVVDIYANDEPTSVFCSAYLPELETEDSISRGTDWL